MHLFDNLGMALRWLRDRRGKKQYELAEAAGITKGMLCAYETGKQRPSLETLDKILYALDADLVALNQALTLVSRCGALQVTETATVERPGDYPLPTGSANLLSDLHPESLARALGGLGVLMRELLELLQRLPAVTAASDVRQRPPSR